MTKREELDNFLEKINELIESSYVLADIKIANILKSIALSDTLLAVFKNCLEGFDYTQAQKKYLVKNAYLPNEKGQFVLPSNSKELLAFVFNILVDIDAKRIDFSMFLQKYFYEDGSFFAGYSSFITLMIKPFRSAVITIMESVLDGKVQDPIEAITEREEKLNKAKFEREVREQKDKELSKTAYGNSVRKIKSILLADKQKINGSKMKEDAKEETTLIIDMLANVVDSNDKDAITYAFISYKYCMKAHPFKFFGRTNKIIKLLKDVYNEL